MVKNHSYRERGRKEGNVLFNDALNTFYIRLYGVRHMVKNHSYRERENPLPPHGHLFPNSSKGSFICIIPDKTTRTMTFVTPVVVHWLEREISQCVHHEGSIRRSITLLYARCFICTLDVLFVVLLFVVLLYARCFICGFIVC